MRYDQYYLAIHRYSPSGRFCENGISLTFILRRSVPRQLHAGAVRLWQWTSNHSDLGKKELTIIFPIFSTNTSTLMISIQKKCISEFTDKLQFKNLLDGLGGGWSSLSRVGSGHGVFLGGRGRGDSQWCVSAGASQSIGCRGPLRVASVAWSQGGGGGGVVWGWQCWWWLGRGWVLRWLGVWASRWVVWVLRVRAVRSLRSLAGCGAEVRVGGGRMGVWVGLWSEGNRWLPVDGASWYGVWVGGLLVVPGCSY